MPQLLSDQVSYETIKTILSQLALAARLPGPGDVVEFGCYVGTTSVYIADYLQTQTPDSSFHVYDSFSGLPEKQAADNSPAGSEFVAGQLVASKKTFVRNFRDRQLPLPVIHKGWFADLGPSDVPRFVRFAFLDGDFYDSIFASLQLVWPVLIPGGIICIDDYQRPALPGVEKAVTQYFQGRAVNIQRLGALGIIKKPL